MDGPGWETYVIPPEVPPVLAFWLISVYYAAAHPVHEAGRSAGGRSAAVAQASHLLAVGDGDTAVLVPLPAGPAA